MSNRGGNPRYSNGEKREDEEKRWNKGRPGEYRGGEYRGGEYRGGEHRGGEKTRGGEYHGREKTRGAEKTRGGEPRGEKTRGGEHRGEKTRGGEHRGGEKHRGGEANGVTKSRRNKMKIVPCSAAAKGECKRKDCRFYPCCNERGNEPKYVDEDESAPRQTYVESRHNNERTYGTQKKYSLYDESKGYYNANGDFVNAYTGPVLRRLIRSDADILDSIALSEARYGNPASSAISAPAVKAPVAPVVAVKAPVAPVVAVKAQLTFNQVQFNRFMQTFDVNCGNVDTLIDSDPEFKKYIRANEGAIKNDIKQLREVLSGTRKVVDATAWIHDLFAKKVLDINNFPGGNISEAAIRHAVHCGIYRVFRTYQTGDAIDSDTVTGFVLCMFGCMVANRNKTKINMPTFVEFSSNVFHGVYV